MECVICLDTIDTSYTLNCSHAFHENCIRQWLLVQNCCPVCRKETTEPVVESASDEHAIDIISTHVDTLPIWAESSSMKLGRLIISSNIIFGFAVGVSFYVMIWALVIIISIVTLQKPEVLTLLFAVNSIVFLSSLEVQQCCFRILLSFGVNGIVLFVHLICSDIL